MCDQFYHLQANVAPLKVHHMKHKQAKDSIMRTNNLLADLIINVTKNEKNV